MLKSKRKFISLVVAAFLVLLPLTGHAAGLVPCGGNGEAPCTVNDMFYLVGRLTNYLIEFSGLFAISQLVLAGFRIVISQGNQEAVQKQRNHITNAIIGLVLVFSAYVIVTSVVNVLQTSSASCKIDMTKPSNYINLENCSGSSSK